MLIDSLLQWLLPPTCVLCNQPSNRKLDLCYACEADLPWIDHGCTLCAKPLVREIIHDQVCGECLTHPPAFDITHCLFHYQEPVDQLITSLKFHNQLVYANILGELFVQHARLKQLPDCIIPVPLHPRRLRQRGFNQALELARHISKKLRVPLNIYSCQRVRDTIAQSETPAKKRYSNVHKAFKIIHELDAKHVAIVDDVVTTGHTVRELSKILKASGVTTVEIWCCARTSIYK